MERVVRVTIDPDGPSRPISRWIYGTNGVTQLGDEPGVFTVIRFGGNRTTTYNWENNASNAGRDWPTNQNDGYLSRSDAPGAAVLDVLDAARRQGAAALITVPIIGRVAADKRADGDVSTSDNFLETRFVRSVARCERKAPDPSDGIVCQNAFVRFVRREAERRGVPLMFALDNEPACWSVAHPLLRGGQRLTYAELVDRSVEYATMIAEEAPGAQVLGPVTFGWPAMMRLIDAPDARNRDFLAHYLDVMRAASVRRGRRLLHAVDTHWYPDARVGETAVTSPGDSAELAQLRMQMPRSLYDASYREPTWIVNDWLHQPVRLLPRLSELARQHYPETEVAITEWAYGGAAHPSGAVAVADALGAMGRYGVWLATYWPLFDQPHVYATAAFRMYRAPAPGVSFGDRSIAARSSDRARVSAWASLDSEHPGRVVVVLVCRADQATAVHLTTGDSRPRQAQRFVLDAAAPRPRPADPVRWEERGTTLHLPPRSVSTLVLDPLAN